MMLTVIQHLLTLHPLGNAHRNVVRNTEELNDLTEDRRRVRLCLERSPDHGGEVRLAVPRPAIPVDDLALNVFRAGGQALLPRDETAHAFPL
jgi:hypothetical protein